MAGSPSGAPGGDKSTGWLLSFTLATLLLCSAAIIASSWLRPGGIGCTSRRLSEPSTQSILAMRPLELKPTWEPLFTPEEQQRGITYWGSGSSLRRLAARLLAGAPVKVVAIGGSVTAMGGLGPGESYIARFTQALSANFPTSNITFANKGMGAWNSERFEPCIARIVPEDSDLVVVEFAINDMVPSQPWLLYNSSERRAYEGIVRHLLRMPRAPALLLLHVYPFNQAGGDGVTEGLFYREPEGQLTVLAHYYDLPVVSLRAAAYHLMRVGVEGFKVDKVSKAIAASRNIFSRRVLPLSEPGEEWRYFYFDSVHPSARGALALAELLLAPLQRALGEQAEGLRLGRRADPRLDALPPPMIPHSPEHTTSFCAMLEDFRPLVRASEGFEWRPQKPSAASFVEQKWGWAGQDPGAWVELEVDSRLGGEAQAAPATATSALYLTYLMSYENMGVAAVACVAGCACKPSSFDAQDEDKGVSVFLNHRVQVSQHQACRLRVTIADSPKPEGELRKIVLSALMIRH